MSNRSPGFGDVANPFGEVDNDVEDRYIPPSMSTTPTMPSWDQPSPQRTNDQIEVEDDEPFTAAHLAAATQSSVPSATAADNRSAAPPPPPPQRPQQHPLPFTTSVPAQSVTGKIGPPSGTSTVPSVSRLASAPDTARLLPSSTGSGGGGGGGNTNNNTNSSSSPAGLPIEDPSTYPFYSIKRYRTFFNVDTDEVLHRIFRSVALFFKGDFFDHISENPDLYGPFWIASTLVFVSAAAGNTASYIAYRKASSPHGDTPPAPSDPSTPTTGWYYDVDKVGGSMGLFYGYVGVVGVLLWVALRWGFKARMGLAKIWCAYGYALAVFIPIAALCVLPMEAVRWSLVGAATAASGVFLVSNFRATVVEAAGAQAVPVLLVMVVAHAALGLALKLYFFRYSY